MARRPPSVVFKTKKPTPAQKVQVAAARVANPSGWSPKVDPIVSAGPPGTGLHLTRSGRYVNQNGMYQGGITPTAQAAAAANANRQPVRTSPLGVVQSPVLAAPPPVRQRVAPKPAPAVKKAVVVKQHVRAAPTRPAPTVSPTVTPTKPTPVVKKPVTTGKPDRQPATGNGNPGGNAGLYGGVGPDAYVNSIYGPLEASLVAQQKARSDALKQLVSEFAASLSGMQKDLAPYGAAAQSQQATADASAGSFAAENPNAQAQSDLSAIGAPASQQAQVAQNLQNTFGGGADLLRYLGGTQPAGVFAQDAAGRAAYLQSLPNIGLALASQGLNKLGFQAGQESLQLGSQKATALQTAHQNLANFVQENKKTALAQQVAQAELGLKFKASTQADKRIALSAASQTKAQKNADRTYQLQVARLGLESKRLQLQALAAAKKQARGGFSAAQTARFRSDAYATAQEAFQGVYDKNNTLVHPKVPYQQVINDFHHKYPTVPLQYIQFALNQYWLPNAPGSTTAKIGGETYVYFPEWEQPNQGRPLGVPSLAAAKKKRR